MSDKPIRPAGEPEPDRPPTAESGPSQGAAPTPPSQPAPKREKRASAKKAVQRTPDKPAGAAKKSAPKASKTPADKPPARLLRRAADPAPKAVQPKAEKPPEPTIPPAPAVVQAKAEAPREPAKPPEIVKPQGPAAAVPPTAAKPARVLQRAPAAEDAPALPPLEAMARTVTSRLQRTQLTLSPWTQRTLRGRGIADVENEPGTSDSVLPGTTGSRPAETLALTGARMQSLTRRVQRQEERATNGTFGRISNGVQRAERFAGTVSAHYPELASKYELPAMPSAEAGSAPAPPNVPSFTYYPESGAGAGQGRGAGGPQPTMTAAEVLQRFGGDAAQRTPAPTPAPTAAPAPQKPKPPRDIRTQRRFSKVEEYTSKSEAPPIAEAPTTPTELAQRRAEAAGPAAPRPTPPPARARQVQDSTRTQTPEPTPPAETNAGPLRWDHLNNLPPSVQRQLEQVQRTRAEEVGQVSGEPPMPPAEPPRPFRPRNPMPPPAAPPQPPPARRAEPPAEPPISFGPDLTPRTAAIQREPEPPPAEPPMRTVRARPPETPVAQRRVEERPGAVEAQPPSEATPARDVAMPLAPPARPMTPEANEAAEDIFDTAAKQQPAPPFETPAPTSVQRTVEEQAQARSEMPLREPPVQAALEPPPAASVQSEAGLVQRDVNETPKASVAPPAPERPAAQAPRAVVPEAPASPRPVERAAAPTTPPVAAPVERPAATIQRSPERAVAPEQPLILREPVEPRIEPPVPVQRAVTPVEDEAESPVEAAPAPTAESPAPAAMAVEPAPIMNEEVQRQPAEEPLVLREPPAPPRADASPTEPAPQAPAKPQAVTPTPSVPPVQRQTPVQAPPVERVEQPLTLRQPPAPPAEVEARPEPPAEVQRTSAPAEMIEQPPALAEPPELPTEPEPAAIQRSATPAPMIEQPLTLREPAAPIAEDASEVDPGGPATEELPVPRAAIPPVQRQTGPEELPLRAPDPPAEPIAPAAEPASPAPKATIQRRASPEVPLEPLPLRDVPTPPSQPSEPPAAEPRSAQPLRSEAVSRPTSEVQRSAASEPTAPAETAETAKPIEPPAERPMAAKIQRQSDGGEGQPQVRPALPLREPPAPPTPPAGSESNARDLGDQVYARMLQGATLSHLDMPATGTRPAVQRRPGNGQAHMPLAEPPQPRGLARSSPANTPVLPQARIQREFEPAPATPPGDSGSPLWPSPARTSGILPLAPPQSASPSAARRAGITTTGVQALPLAPTIQRHDVPDGGSSTITTRPRSNAISTGSTYTPDSSEEDDDDDMGLVRLFEQDYAEDEIDVDTPIAPDTETTDGINLDELADKVMPYLKRLIKIERERYNPI